MPVHMWEMAEWGRTEYGEAVLVAWAFWGQVVQLRVLVSMAWLMNIVGFHWLSRNSRFPPSTQLGSRRHRYMWLGLPLIT